MTSQTMTSQNDPLDFKLKAKKRTLRDDVAKLFHVPGDYSIEEIIESENRLGRLDQKRLMLLLVMIAKHVEAIEQDL